MWDPISIFACAWILNIGLPDGRLSVNEVIKAKEQKVIVDNIQSSVKLREGI